MDTLTAPSSTYLQGDHPPRTGEEEEKKPVLKKVKDKVKKIKNAISKKSHGHGDKSNDDDHHQHGDLDEGDEGFVEDDEMMEEPEIHGAPMYDNSAIGMGTGGKEMSGGRGAERVGDGLGLITKDFIEDPAAPKSTDAEANTRIEHSRGGEEVDVSPELCRSLEAMTKGQNTSYTDMVSSAASKMYEIVADAGTAVISKVKRPDGRRIKDGEDEALGKQQGKGISIKEYITEKLTPGEDEKALSELITESGQKRKNETASEVERAGVVDRLRETFTSLLGGGEGSSKSPETESQKKVAEDNKDFHR